MLCASTSPTHHHFAVCWTSAANVVSCYLCWLLFFSCADSLPLQVLIRICISSEKRVSLEKTMAGSVESLKLQSRSNY